VRKMENKENEGSQIKRGDKVTIRETPRTKKRGIANQPAVVTRVDGEDVYVVYDGLFGVSGPYQLKIDEVEKVLKGDEKNELV
jgi:transcription antitermination factor NusG